MKGFIKKQYFFRRNMLAIIGLCLTVYFSYHLIAGHRGYVRLMSLEHKIESAQAEQSNLVMKREAIEKKVVMMRPGSMDRDLFEERVRIILGFNISAKDFLRQNSL